MNTMLSVVPESDAALPMVYAAATQALAECSRIDECKAWSDKSAALASYAKQAKDDTLVRMARQIQARAVRRMGELLKEIEPGRNQHDGSGGAACGGTPTSRSEAARQAGLSRDQKVTALRVASVPKDIFEAEVESRSPPTVTKLAEQGRRVDVVHAVQERHDPHPFEGSMDRKAPSRRLTASGHIKQFIDDIHVATEARLAMTRDFPDLNVFSGFTEREACEYASILKESIAALKAMQKELLKIAKVNS